MSEDAPEFIYLDNGASTPLDTRVFEEMRPYFTEHYANSSSSHRMGLDAGQAVESARRRLARLWDVQPDEVVFTSGGTESDVLGIRGLALSAPRGRDVVWFFALEHPAVLAQRSWLEARGFEVRELPATREGVVCLEHLKQHIDARTALVAVMHVNNEIGSVQPLADIRRIIDSQASGAFLHVDAVQSFTKTPVFPARLGATTLAIAAHKFHGPKGVGALYIKRGTPLVPLVVGGGHERGLRAGTSNTPGIIGMVSAAELALEAFEHDVARMVALRDTLAEGIVAAYPEVEFNGTMDHRQCNNLNIYVPGCAGGRLLSTLEANGVIASAGSACQASHSGPSAVLRALGRLDPESANLRLTLSRLTTIEEIASAIPRIVRAVRQARA